MDDKYAHFMKRFQVSNEDILNIANAEQRSEAWHAARKFRLTTSNFAAAVGHNPYTTPQQLADNMIANTFKGNAATQWGVDHEDFACAMYEHYKRQTLPDLHVHHTGLQIDKDLPYIGVSPDGIVKHWDPMFDEYKRYLLEIKCPYSWEAKLSLTGGFYDNIVPDYYYDQLQGGMGFLKLPCCDFVVWNPQGMQITRIQFDKVYFESFLKPGLVDFYTNTFLPTLETRCPHLFVESQLAQ